MKTGKKNKMDWDDLGTMLEVMLAIFLPIITFGTIIYGLMFCIKEQDARLCVEYGYGKNCNVKEENE